jgi:uridine phosphorylase
MTFPKYKNKHLEEALFRAHDVVADIATRRNMPKHFPQDYVMVYDRGLLSRMIRKYSLKSAGRIFANCRLYQNQGIGFVKVDGIGSPHAVTVFEELIAVGGKRFINIGTAGGLQKEGFFLCDKAVRDEGTSYHYVAHGHFSHPDSKLTEKLGESMKRLGLQYETAPTWTVDAPYMETKAEIARYKNQGVATVEMEASALFAVAKLRKVKIASAFVVSDVLGEKWEPKFHHFNTKQGLNKLVEAAFDCLKK